MKDHNTYGLTRREFDRSLTRRAKWAVTCTLCDKSRLIFVSAKELTSGQRSGCKKHNNPANQWRYPLEYRRYKDMIRRTSDPNVKGYEDVEVAKEWLPMNGGFDAFLEYMLRTHGPCPQGMSNDRIDSSGDYRPGNVRWATKKIQSQNRKTSRYVHFKGSKLNITDFARLIGWYTSRLKRWLDSGKTPEQIATEAGYEKVTI